MYEGNNMGIMTTLKKPTLERGGMGGLAPARGPGQQQPVATAEAQTAAAQDRLAPVAAHEQVAQRGRPREAAHVGGEDAPVAALHASRPWE